MSEILGGLTDDELRASPVDILTNGTISDGSNNSTSPLGASATFTGAGEQNNLSDVMVSCQTDAAGILYFDFSVDGTNWSTFPSGGFAVAAGIHEFHTAVKGPRYFRVRLVNGTSAQTYLRLYAYFGQFRHPSAPMNQPVGLDADSIMVRTVPWWLDASRGLLTGINDTKKFGRNDAVGTSFVPVALGGNYRTPQSTAATALRIKAGGNANDTAAGTGAREITLQGLDENFNEVTETLATAGTAASSATTTTFTRLYRVWVSASGSYADQSTPSHVGQITIENSAGTQDWAYIDATGFPKGQSEIGAFSIPANKSGVVKLKNVSIDSGKTVDILFFSRTNIDQTAAPYDAMRTQSVISGVTGGAIETFGGIDIPLGPYVGPTDIGFMAKVTTGTAIVSVEFEVIVLDEI